ncbi:hypothetical protein, partial [Azospirillum doebereinerae]|uniref:hypothetical protein n=1 Tax=Azospirillum doebereinerae TaxID=92933 RepID=UPI001B3C013C
MLSAVTTPVATAALVNGASAAYAASEASEAAHREDQPSGDETADRRVSRKIPGHFRFLIPRVAGRGTGDGGRWRKRLRSPPRRDMPPARP